MRSQVFAKSLPMPMVIGALKRLELLIKHPEMKDKLWENALALQKGLREIGFDLGETESPVTPIFLDGGVSEAANILVDLRENYNLFCTVVIYPVVPKDTIMFRLIPTAVHTMEEVEYTVNAFKEIQLKLKEGKYQKEVDKVM